MVSWNKGKKSRDSSPVTIERRNSISSVTSKNSHQSTSPVPSDVSTKSSKRQKKSSAEAFFTKRVARALGRICEIDQSHIESRLRKKANISLRNVRLLPKIVHRTEQYEFVLNGTIDSCILSWRWNISRGKKEGASLVKSSSLVIEGLNVQVEPRKITLEKGMSSMSVTDIREKAEDEENTKEKKNWWTKMKNQIIEDIALRIVDARITIAVPDLGNKETIALQREIVILMKDVELKSLGRTDPKVPQKSKEASKHEGSVPLPLLQRFHVGSISSHIEMNNSQGARDVHPLIDPFRYEAYLKKFHGDRFAGGLNTGYDVIGDIMRKSTTVQVPRSSSIVGKNLIARHSARKREKKELAKVDAVEINSSCGEVETTLPKPSFYRPMNQRGKESNLPKPPLYRFISNKEIAKDVIHFSLGTDQVDTIMALFSIVRIPPSIHKVHSHHTQYGRPGNLESIKTDLVYLFQNSTRNLTKESKFDLPLEAISLELPNGAFLSLPQCKFTKHKGDSASIIFNGKHGVILDHKTFYEYGREYSINFGDRTIILKPSDEEHEVDNKVLRIKLSTLQRVTKGLGEIVDILRIYVPRATVPSENPWSLDVEGGSQLIL